MQYPLLKEAKLKGKRVLVRVDHNIETDAAGKLKSDKKIRASLPTLQLLLSQGARLILMTHVGRPKGKQDPKLSTKLVAEHLKTLLPAVKITHTTDTIGPKVEQLAAALKDGEILYVENVRFSAGEEGKPAEQAAFGKELAKLGEVYVNEAFPVCHTYEEASTCAVARLLPAYPGLNLLHESQTLQSVLDDPRRPVTLIISGAKMETKIPVIQSFLNKGDDILLGGCIANTFIAARGFEVGTSKYEEDKVELSQELMLEGEKEELADIHVPRDVVVATEATEAVEKLDLPLENVTGDMMILDVGKVTVERYKKIIAKSGTIIWNGPLGMYELNRFSHGTKRIAEAIVEVTKHGAVSIVGGGDTIDFHKRYDYPTDGYTFVSTGGGAMLEMLSGEEMPALKALAKREK
ncbi:MAG: phosphoglycerate kinase [Candidatus Peribacteraceae bacterium]|nr:phosphoglycerate kinase [Candidatus Peribacteraceae bacterium]MDD5742684.1 phosphoglycerate kinase [Candidatus Peribacteraceae bacterium]